MPQHRDASCMSIYALILTQTAQPCGPADTEECTHFAYYFLNKRSKGLTMQINFPRPPLIIFTKGANNSDHDCVYIYIHLYIVRKHSKMTSSTCDMGFRVL